MKSQSKEKTHDPPPALPAALVLIVQLVSCGMSKEHVERRVADEFQNRLDNDAGSGKVVSFLRFALAK
jgi:hypothetical protein